MTLPKCSWLIFFALAAASALSAAEITGKVRDASGDAATVVIDGDAPPAVGDSAEIYFKVPGADEEISVASGKVTAVEAKVVKVKIETTTGTIEKDQLARFKSGSPPQALTASPSPAASPSVPSKSSPIIGDWVAPPMGQDKGSLSFKDDGTVLIVEERGGVVAKSVVANYRVDTSVTPHVVEIFFDPKEGETKGHVMRGIFELQSNGRLKVDLSKSENPSPGFTEAGTVVLSRATAPIVRPSSTVAPAASPSATRTEVSPQPSAAQISTPSPEVRELIDKGIELQDRGQLDAAVEVLTKAIKLDPKAVDAYWWRGSCYDLKNNHTAAIRDWNEVGRLDPSQRESRQKLMEELNWEEKAKKEQQSKKR